MLQGERIKGRKEWPQQKKGSKECGCGSFISSFHLPHTFPTAVGMWCPSPQAYPIHPVIPPLALWLCARAANQSPCLADGNQTRGRKPIKTPKILLKKGVKRKWRIALRPSKQMPPPPHIGWQWGEFKSFNHIFILCAKFQTQVNWSVDWSLSTFPGGATLDLWNSNVKRH
jgi:hypothetical protein